MTSSVAESIRRGLEQAVAYTEGKADTGGYGVHIPATIDVRSPLRPIGAERPGEVGNTPNPPQLFLRPKHGA